METIIPHISEWFLSKEPWLRVFAQHGAAVEGWFKGETLLCLERLRASKKIENFEREYTPGEKGWAYGQKTHPAFRYLKYSSSSIGSVVCPCWVGAICPNCHREIHYGKRGQALNRQLEHYLKNLERS